MKQTRSSHPTGRPVPATDTASLLLLCALIASMLPGGAVASMPPAAATGAGAVADSSPGSSGIDFETFELANGMRFLMVQRPEMATVGGAWVAHVGAANERPGITGMAHLFEHMMFKGSTTIGTRDIERDLEIIAQQEEVQEQIRGIYRDLRRRARQGEIDDPYAAENRPPELVALEERFAELVQAQREVMVKDEFDQIYTAEGATFMNAFTNNDNTVYFISVPANKLELWFWMESERLLNPVFREFYSERDVVYEERRLRTESTPTGEFDELVEAMFWQSHPYSWPVVGWPSDLRVISKAQADAFYDTYYAPNNLSAVLVGNFDPAAVRTLAERYFGRLERGPAVPDVVTLEMEQRAEKRMNGECDCQPQVEVRYHTVAFLHPDSYALDILQGVLNGRAGRLYGELVDGREIASSARSLQASDKYAGYFSFTAEAKGDATPAQLEQAWYDVLRQLQQEPVAAEELRRVKNVQQASVFRSLQNPLFMMLQLAILEGLGDATYYNTLADRLEAVTAEDVQRVARQYFEPSNRLVASYTRKAGTSDEPVAEELAGLPDQVRRQVEAQIAQLAQIDDVERLRGFLAQMTANAASVPEEMRAGFEYVRQKLEARIAELTEE
ncbi:MAG: insulinase family protein [Acidobacteria bacterium]|nr:MAG: insulinase family protein [Acidobacteriota bacterium]REK00246.1 MAG: insulinase family protein [Acidobacteriota bacterium]